MSQILIIYTGGTIGMMSDPATKVLKPINFEQIMDNVPELDRLNCKIKVHSFANIIDSSNMNPAIWSDLAGLIAANYDTVDGFVILHGSDTMSFTASALSFMLENLAKPVIFTGSQLPISAIRTDAKENLMTAIEIANAKKTAPAYRKFVYISTINYSGAIAHSNIIRPNLRHSGRRITPCLPNQAFTCVSA
jgi:L-asparaginase